MPRSKKRVEIALVGEVDDWEEDVVKTMVEAPAQAECTLYFDSMGGSVYGALAITTLMRQRQLRCTGIILGECSSASLLIFAACERRLVTRYSTMLFHRMRWQSEKRVEAQQAALWARHFEEMEKEIDALQIRYFGKAEDLVRAWTASGQYVSGHQLVEAGLAEMLEV